MLGNRPSRIRQLSRIELILFDEIREYVQSLMQEVSKFVPTLGIFGNDFGRECEGADEVGGVAMGGIDVEEGFENGARSDYGRCSHFCG